ncbi:hypothetical protein B0H17DRAFT_1148817 [Mycena rosella]|uniref:Uncharacterized protein n=1 Tax=Mycena rosella TaxID=1033263 RepID=A0AAD7C9Z8_MYCRO|nr:hypothetical protein B0H17DRAFT_1148817 [Mycena rosella]
MAVPSGEVLEMPDELPRCHPEDWIGHEKYIPQALQNLRVPQFALVPLTTFLCLLSNSPEPTNVGLRVSVADEHFKTLNGFLGNIIKGVKSLGTRSGGRKVKKVAGRKVASDAEDSDS